MTDIFDELLDSIGRLEDNALPLPDRITFTVPEWEEIILRTTGKAWDGKTKTGKLFGVPVAVYDPS
jgi:hypothetical protein